MAEETKIQWCDHTFNPWIGCAKVSPGCANCYAEVSTPSRARGIKWGKGQPRQRTSAGNWREPLRWNRQAEKRRVLELHSVGAGEVHNFQRPRVFCASLADWLDDEVPIEWLADLLKLIHDTPNLDWLLLTKRPENFAHRLHKVCHEAKNELAVRWHMLREAPANVWIGTTVEDQQRADERIPALLRIPARVRFLSVEPLLGAVDFDVASLVAAKQRTERCFADWVIVGGESGAKARPCNVEWIRGVVRQCQAAGVPCFVKQLGAQPRGWCRHFLNLEGHDAEDDPAHYCDAYEASDTTNPCSRCVFLEHPKGGDPAEWPVDLRVREFPGNQQKATEGAKG